MNSPITASHPPAWTTRPGRIWALALAAALLASIAAWIVEEASLYVYGEKMAVTAAPPDYRPDIRKSGGAYGANMATMAYKQEYTARAVAVSGAAVGVMFGLALGAAMGLAGGSTVKSWLKGAAIGLTVAATAGTLGWLLAWNLVPLFYQARDYSPDSPRVLESLLLIRGIPRMIAGFAGGLTLGLALGGGWDRMLRGALGGFIGAALGAVLVVVGDEMFAILIANVEAGTTPILRSPGRRAAAIVAVSFPTAIGATWAILGVKPEAKTTPSAVTEV